MITSCIMRNYKHPLDVLERLDPEWERAVRDLHPTGWRFQLFPHFFEGQNATGGWRLAATILV